MSNRASSREMGSPPPPRPSQRSNEDAHYDSNEKPPKAERLHWAMDPTESSSDWKIEVRAENKIHGTYYVHRCIIAVGERKSEYFVRACRRGDHEFSEAANSMSRIELERLAAVAFPFFLDYVYSGELQISTEIAMGLRKLARYFENQDLRYRIRQFINHDLTAETAGTYYKHSQILFDEPIEEAVVDLCVAKSLDIAPHHSIVIDPSIPPQLWLEILPKALEAPQQQEPAKRCGIVWVEAPVPDAAHYRARLGKHLSTLVAYFCWERRDWEDSDIDCATFQELTSEEHLPDIDFQAALLLIALERQLSPFVQLAPQRPNTRAAAQDNNNTYPMTGLQERCLTSLHGNWGNVDYSQGEDLKERLRLVNPEMLVNLLLSVQSDAMELSRQLKHAQTAYALSWMRAVVEPDGVDWSGLGELDAEEEAHAAANINDQATDETTTSLQQLYLASLHGNPATRGEDLKERLRHETPEMLVELLVSAQAAAAELRQRLQKHQSVLSIIAT